MFRWSYLLPRVLIAVAIAAFLEWGMGPLFRFAILPTLGNQRRVAIETKDLHIGLLSGKVSASHARVSLTAGAKQRQLTAERLAAALDRQALWHGKWHLSTLNLQGLEWREQAVERDEDEQRPGPSFADWLSRVDQDSVRSWADGWMRSLGDELVEESQTARVTLELKQRWSSEFDQQRAKLERWSALIRELEQRWAGAQSPAERLQLAAQLATQGRNIERALLGVLRDLERMRNDVEADRRELDRAQAADRKRLQELADVRTLPPERLNEMVLGPGVAATIEKLQSSWSWMRQGLGVALAKPRTNRLGERGVDFDFDRGNDPDWWLKQAHFDARSYRGGKAMQVRGVVRDLTNEPEKAGRPTVIEWRGDESFPIVGRWVRELPGGSREEHWQLKWAPLKIESERWSSDDDIAVTVNNLVGTVWLEGVRTSGGESGRLVWRIDQGSASVAWSIGGQIERWPVDLSPLRRQPIVAEWSREGGDWHLRVRSVLGQQLATVAQARAAQWVRARQARLDRRIAQQRREFELWLEAKLAEHVDQASHLQQLVTDWQSELARARNALRWLR